MKQTIYLTRDESNIIKGILILLIVLGHNHFLMDGEYVRLQIQLYKFHVIEFFILPFFYKMKADTSWEHLRDIIVRNWVPYLWILSACYLTSCIYFHKIGLEWGHISAILLGTQTHLSKYYNFVFPWFLPTYCSFFILYLLSLKHKWLYGIMIILSVVTWGCTWEEFYWFKNTMPLGIGLAIGYFAYGWMASALNSLSAYMKYAGAVVFVVINILLIMDIRVPMGSTLLVPTFFLLLLALLPHLNFKWLKTIGENSLGIYLFNMFIINILCALLPNNLITGVFIFIVSVCLSLFISICINKRMFLKRILFPSSIKDIKNCFNTK